ncbi:unnamed protein product [Trifolium pratense]|uniref:Uncharacterized protein n=1 Tax=Trifolium pratense TaxID=57577 RepID=A0ACB0LJ36_TRIPR|nr:unnamed protein product [Trifolium pratense]
MFPCFAYLYSLHIQKAAEREGMVMKDMKSSSFRRKLSNITKSFMMLPGSVQVQHANKVVNSQGSTVIWKPKSHGTVLGEL